MTDEPTDGRRRGGGPNDDDALGRILRHQVPAPGPGYWDEIDRRLAAAESTTATEVRVGTDTDPDVIRLTDMTPSTRNRLTDRLPILGAVAAALIVVAGTGFLLSRTTGTDTDTVTGAASDSGSGTEDAGPAGGSAAEGQDDGQPADLATIRWCYQGGELAEGVTAYADLSAPLAEEPTVRIAARSIVGGQTFYEVVDGTAAADGAVTGDYRNLTNGTVSPATFVAVGEDFLNLADDVLAEPTDCAAVAADLADIDENIDRLEATAPSVTDDDLESLADETPMVWDVAAAGDVSGRLQPGLGAEIVRTYERDDTNLFGTGRRATADDLTWVEIDGAPDAAAGSTWWVAEAELVAVGPVVEPYRPDGVTALPAREASAWFTTAGVDARDQPGFINEPSSAFPADTFLSATGTRVIVDELEWIEVERFDGTGLVWVALPELAPASLVDGGFSYAFTSPSGNIACNMSGFGASCWISEKDWEIEQPDGPDCEISDWGNAVDVVEDGTVFPCYTDMGWDPFAPALDYGSVVEVASFRCESAPAGVTCRNAAGQGFTLSRAEVIRF